MDVRTWVGVTDASGHKGPYGRTSVSGEWKYRVIRDRIDVRTWVGNGRLGSQGILWVYVREWGMDVSCERKDTVK